MLKKEYVVAAPAPIAPITGTGTIRQAALAAAETFAPNEIEKHAQAVMDVWKARLEHRTKEYTRSMLARAAKPEPVIEVGGAISQPSLPYPWFNLICAGPYQFTPSGGYLPNKVVRYDEYAYMIGCIWRNPAGVNWDPYAPPAADLMSGYDFQVWFENVNLTTVSDGPDLGPYSFVPIGGGYLNLFAVYMPPGTFPAPTSGRAHLYEINMTMDVTGPGYTVAGLPFSGFATWIFDPDAEQEIPVPPYLPATSEKPVAWHYDIPVRFLVHA
ncbi:MAG: hypothetical protein U0559_18440 [Anaerolineae bacterium]